MKREKYIHILERLSFVIGTSTEKVEEAFLTLTHENKRSLLHDLKRILRNYKGIDEVFSPEKAKEYVQKIFSGKLSDTI